MLACARLFTATLPPPPKDSRHQASNPPPQMSVHVGLQDRGGGWKNAVGICYLPPTLREGGWPKPEKE